MRLPDRLSRLFKALRGLSAFEVAALAVIAGAVALRLFEFWKLPGINGDEAWYGVQALRFADDEQVTWRTPTGNLLSPMQAGALWLLHLFFEPSPALLRVPTLVASLLEIGVVGFAAGRTFGRQAGFSAALLCAALPVNVAYARFGWDPSHLGLWAALASFAVLRRHLLLGVVLYAFGLWVHPTNVFLAPFLVFAFVGAELTLGRGKWAWLRSGAVLVLLGAATLLLKVITQGSKNFPTVETALGRVGSLDAWNDHGVALAQFFLGGATYEYITGAKPPGGLGAWGSAFWALIAALLVLGCWRIVRHRDWTAAGIVLGAIASHVAFFVLAGPAKLAPHQERFGLCLVVPSLFAVVALAFPRRPAAPHPASAPAPSSRLRWMRIGRGLAWTLGCVALMVGFTRYYLVELKRTGSNSHATFWTGPIEPKKLAVRRILSERRQDAPLVILTDGWWTSWIALYLTHDEPDVTVANAVAKSVLEAPHVDVFVMGFPNGPALGLVKKIGPERFERRDVPGYGRASAIAVWRKKLEEPEAPRPTAGP